MESIGFAWGTSNPPALSEQEVDVEDELAGTFERFGFDFAISQLVLGLENGLYESLSAL